MLLLLKALLSLTSLVAASDLTLKTMTSPLSSITYPLLSPEPFSSADDACRQLGGRLAEVDADGGEVGWLGSWMPTGSPAWIASLNGLPYKCAAVYAGGAVAIPKASSRRGVCYNREYVLCELTDK